jgi:hypothetical protein
MVYHHCSKIWQQEGLSSMELVAKLNMSLIPMGYN